MFDCVCAGSCILWCLRNCLVYTDSAGFVRAVERALTQEPSPMSDEELRWVDTSAAAFIAAAPTACWAVGAQTLPYNTSMHTSSLLGMPNCQPDQHPELCCLPVMLLGLWSSLLLCCWSDRQR